MRVGQQEGERRNAQNTWRKQALSDRLRVLMAEKGLTVTATAKLVQERLSGQPFNPVNITHYRAGRSLPRPRILRALSDVLGVGPEDLAPFPIGDAETLSSPDDHGKALVSVDAQDGLRTAAPDEPSINSIPSFHVEDMSGGEAWLQINQRLSWSTVIKILQVLKGGEPSKT
jgi:transcriptional regulator with XRE-family HTH domain